jgi:hypothetical protein
MKSFVFAVGVTMALAHPSLAQNFSAQNPAAQNRAEIIPKEPGSATTGSAAGSGGGAANSGAGVRGLPGSKSGPTVTPSGTILAEPEVTKPDQSGVPGLPGNKSGKAAQSPR